MWYGPPLALAKLLKYRSLSWLPRYYYRSFVSERDSRKIPVTDLIVLMVDHFEPSRREGEEGIIKVADWCREYENVAREFTDADGFHPQHTWFYRYDYPNFKAVNILAECAFNGFGEIEFHLHHGNDTAESFEKTITEGVAWFNKNGAMIGATPQLERYFAYIAGNWALDNGRFDDRYSGVNNEIEILARNGCYADFTFPAFGEISQPAQINSIYYATEDGKPKSYNNGVPVSHGGGQQGDLMIIQGPLYIDWSNAYVEYAALESFAPHKRERCLYWLNAGIYVAGRPEWRIVKLHTHGMQSAVVFKGDALKKHLSDIEELCNTRGFRLHYVTARGVYNMIKAAESGETGDPGKCRDFQLPPPLNHYLYLDIPYKVKELGDKVILHISEGRPTKIYTRGYDLDTLVQATRIITLNYGGDAAVRRYDTNELAG